ncbi:reverse transcriptase domain-containing protein [Tanacetum coccineum]|uniref:Reverse transcriptase domain-containing protein n=1 Tax=Tanacetum coccineum TaxID=301880 RepID=A0ABQ5HN28_9ASTR
MADARTMLELLQAPTEGYEDEIVILANLADNFELKVGLLQLVTSSQFHGFERDDPYAHIGWFNKIISTVKYQNVSNEAIKLTLFPFSLDRAAQIWLEKEPPRSILTWEDLVSKFVNHFFPPSKTINLKNDITNFQQRFDESFGEAWDRFKDLLLSTTTSSPSPSPDVTALTEIVKELVLMNKATQQATMKAIEETCVTCGGPHPYYECLAIGGNTFDTYAAIGTYNQGGNRYRPQGDPNYRASNQMGPPSFPPPNRQSPSSSGSLPSDIVANPRGDVKAITTRSGVLYEGPSIPPTSSLPKEVERESEVTRDKPNLKPSIPYPSRLNNQKLQEKTNNQMMKFLQIFQRLHFDISATDALLHMPKFASTFKSLLTLADLGAIINLMPLSVWKKLSLPELTPTRMTLELANRSVSYLVGVVEDVFVKVGKFHFLAEFFVVDYDVDPRVSLILERPFLRTARALIDVHGEELTLRVNDEAITFKVGHTSRYSRNYYDEPANQINVIDVACEEYAQEVLGFLDSSTSGNPTPLDPIIASSSTSFTPFEGGDFILEEIETFLHTPYKPSNLDDDYYDTEGDILTLRNC